MTERTRTRWYSDWRNDLAAAGFEFLGTCVFLILSLGTAQSLSVMNNAKPGATLSTSSDYISSRPDSDSPSSSPPGSSFASAAHCSTPTSAPRSPSSAPSRLSAPCSTSSLKWSAPYVLLQSSKVSCPAHSPSTPTPSAGINKAQALFIEMFVTSFLCFAVLMLAVEKHRSTPFAPVGVGITLFACELWSIPLTGGAVNTARAFGPAVASGHFGPAHWVYWLGPTLGAILSSAVYILAKRSHYWNLAPDQDHTDPRKSPCDVPLTGDGPSSPTGASAGGPGYRGSYPDSGTVMMQREPDPAVRAEAGQNFHRQP